MTSDERVIFSVRLPKATVERLKAFCRDQAGKPLYMKNGTLVDQAINETIDRLEAELGESDVDPIVVRTTRTKITTINNRRTPP